MLIRLIKSFIYTRQVYKISNQLGKHSGFSLDTSARDKAIEKMKQLWSNNELLAPILKAHGETPESLERYYMELTLNGAGQWIGGYYVSVASLLFPFPLEYALSNKNESRSEVAFNLLQYFEQGDPFLPIS